jgi:hypothetical protein
MAKKFKLKSIDKDGSIEGHLRKVYTYNTENKKPAAERPNKEISKVNLETFRNMKANPKAYFNFGMNVKDYSIYLYKNLFMRFEREIIRKRLEQYREGMPNSYN